MSNQTGFDYDVLISRLHGGLLAFQGLRAHRRQRDQPPASRPEERPTPPPARTSQPHHAEPAETRTVSSLEPQAFIAMNGRMVPLFGDLGAGMFDSASSSGRMPPTSSETPPAPPRPASPPAPEESMPPQAATAPAPAPSPLKLPLPTPPACLGLIYGGTPRPHTAEPPPPPAAAAAHSPASDGPTAPATSQARPAKTQDAPGTEDIAALLDARAHEEALRLEKIHAEHRACITQILQEHRNELRAQSEANAARTAQLLRDLLAEHRAELARATQTHADHLAQILAQHQQHAHTQHETAAPSEDALRSALIEQATLQREMNEGIAEHIGALTTIVADLGQTVGMLAVAAVQASSQPATSPSTRLHAPPATTTPGPSEIPPGAAVPADSTATSVATSSPLGPAVTPERARASPGPTITVSSWPPSAASPS